ncbi:hypothetical protein Hanom_Chr04g00372671 [Helianthus anomalus]
MRGSHKIHQKHSQPILEKYSIIITTSFLDFPQHQIIPGEISGARAISGSTTTSSVVVPCETELPERRHGICFKGSVLNTCINHNRQLQFLHHCSQERLHTRYGSLEAVCVGPYGGVGVLPDIAWAYMRSFV